MVTLVHQETLRYVSRCEFDAISFNPRSVTLSQPASPNDRSARHDREMVATEASETYMKIEKCNMNIEIRKHENRYM